MSQRETPHRQPHLGFADAGDTPTVWRYFPLRPGYVWTYAEKVVTATQQVLLQRRVTLTIQSRHQNEYVGHWDFQSGRTQLPNVRYRLLHDGIQQAQLTADTIYTGFVYLLKAPLVVDTSWRTVQGHVVRISAVGVSCMAPAGTFSACLETRQEAEPTPTARLCTTRRFAPDLGLVWQQRHVFQREALQRIDTMTLLKLPEPWRL